MLSQRSGQRRRKGLRGEAHVEEVFASVGAVSHKAVGERGHEAAVFLRRPMGEEHYDVVRRRRPVRVLVQQRAVAGHRRVFVAPQLVAGQRPRHRTVPHKQLNHLPAGHGRMLAECWLLPAGLP